jgi:hypothetical protein
MNAIRRVESGNVEVWILASGVIIFSFIFFSFFGHGELMRVLTLSAWDVHC